MFVVANSIFEVITPKPRVPQTKNEQRKQVKDVILATLLLAFNTPTKIIFKIKQKNSLKIEYATQLRLDLKAVVGSNPGAHCWERGAKKSNFQTGPSLASFLFVFRLFKRRSYLTTNKC